MGRGAVPLGKQKCGQCGQPTLWISGTLVTHHGRVPCLGSRCRRAADLREPQRTAPPPAGSGLCPCTRSASARRWSLPASGAPGDACSGTDCKVALAGCHLEACSSNSAHLFDRSPPSFLSPRRGGAPRAVFGRLSVPHKLGTVGPGAGFWGLILNEVLRKRPPRDN